MTNRQMTDGQGGISPVKTSGVPSLLVDLVVVQEANVVKEHVSEDGRRARVCWGNATLIVLGDAYHRV